MKLSKRVRKTLGAHRIFRDYLFLSFLAFAIILLVAIWIVLLGGVRPKDFPVPIGYFSGRGFDMLGPWYSPYMYGLFALMTTVGNTVIATSSYEKSRVGSFLLLVATVALNIFTFVVAYVTVSQIEL